MIRVAVRMPAEVGDPGEFLADARALDAAGAYGIWLAPGGDAGWVLLGAVAASTHRIRVGVDGARDAEGAIAALDRLAGGRVLGAAPSGERWTEMPVPADRKSWVEALSRHEEAGSAGVIIPWDPRLIDLLRNAGDDDRSDLLMSTG